MVPYILNLGTRFRFVFHFTDRMLLLWERTPCWRPLKNELGEPPEVVWNLRGGGYLAAPGNQSRFSLQANHYTD
jgi:hypothetical protein